jgi:hypothetical protein
MYTENTNNTPNSANEEQSTQIVQDSAPKDVKLVKEPMTLNRIRTKNDFFEYLSQNKSELGKTLVGTVIRSQRPNNNIYIFPPAMDVRLSLVQAILSELKNINLEKKLSEMDFLEFKFEGKNYVLAHSGSSKRNDIEELQKQTGGLQSEAIEDTTTIRMIFFPFDGSEPDAADYPLYRFLM